MIEDDPPNQEVSQHQESCVSANQNSVFAPLLNTVCQLIDTLQFLLAPRAMMCHMEEEFNQQLYWDGER